MESWNKNLDLKGTNQFEYEKTLKYTEKEN